MQAVPVSRKGRLSGGATVQFPMEAHELPPRLPDPAHDIEPIHPGSGRGDGLLKRIGAALAAIGLFLAKLGAQAKFLLFALPKLKVFTTSASMLVSVVAYQLIFGWAFSVGFVLLLLLHELGHVFQLRREGVKASAPMFIPFLGAVISAKSMGDDAGAEARVGLAGPILGSIATLVPLGIWLATGSHFWQALAFIGFFINLFNLLPVVPLDGGRIVAALHPAFWVAGFAALVGLVIWRPNPILLIILLFSATELWRRWKLRHHPELQEYYRVKPHQRLIVGALYFGLAILLVLAMHETHVPRDF
jgi:Zn-dependent protease